METKLNIIIFKIFSCKTKEKNNINKINDLRELDNFDSLKFIKSILEIEKKFQIKIKENNLPSFFHRNKILNFIKKK